MAGGLDLVEGFDGLGGEGGELGPVGGDPGGMGKELVVDGLDGVGREEGGVEVVVDGGPEGFLLGWGHGRVSGVG